MKTIKFKKNTTFTGRNGTFAASAIEVHKYRHADYVEINPITSKNRVGNCAINIPVEHLPELIKVLQSAVGGAEC